MRKILLDEAEHGTMLIIFEVTSKGAPGLAFLELAVVCPIPIADRAATVCDIGVIVILLEWV